MKGELFTWISAIFRIEAGNVAERKTLSGAPKRTGNVGREFIGR